MGVSTTLSALFGFFALILASQAEQESQNVLDELRAYPPHVRGLPSLPEGFEVPRFIRLSRSYSPKLMNAILWPIESIQYMKFQTYRDYINSLIPETSSDDLRLNFALDAFPSAEFFGVLSLSEIPVIIEMTIQGPVGVPDLSAYPKSISVLNIINPSGDLSNLSTLSGVSVIRLSQVAFSDFPDGLRVRDFIPRDLQELSIAETAAEVDVTGLDLEFTALTVSVAKTGEDFFTDVFRGSAIEAEL